MFDFRVLVTIVLAVVGFGCVVLLGAFLPQQLDDEDENSKKSTK